MPSNNNQDTIFTSNVKNLSRQIFGKNQENDSMVDQAISYFFESIIPSSDLQSSTRKPTPAKNKKGIAAKEAERTLRHEKLDSLCSSIISLCEGESFDEDNRKSSQLLTTIQLLIPREGSKVSLSNELNKPLYKAVLCLRVLDKLCIDNLITEPYIQKYLVNLPVGDYTSFALADPDGHQKYVEEVKIPLVKAALLQDIGNYHPEAQAILKGSDGKADVFRTLPVEDRKKLLQINYRETIQYLMDGIGTATYLGDSKSEKENFDTIETSKLLFIKKLLMGSINPKQGIGNLLKVPQIYTSSILSTKPNFNYALLPKVYQVLYQNADKGLCSHKVVDTMREITGIFPLGYGVTYLAEDAQNERKYNYEYAIVKGLYPEDPELPICRTATRHLAFISFGRDIVIPKDCNLHYPEVVKKFNTIGEERLNEILSLLSSNYIERKKDDIIPRYWFANEYFQTKTHQKLWNR